MRCSDLVQVADAQIQSEFCVAQMLKNLWSSTETQLQ